MNEMGWLLQTSPRLHVTETDGWLVSHRSNSALPGYLIVSSKTFAGDLSELPTSALCELGPLLAQVQGAIKQELNALRVYVGRYGHAPGHTVHFHVIPIYDWVEELFWQDSRYRVLEGLAEGEGEAGTDGAELTLFVWREFCERAEPPPIKGLPVYQAVELLRKVIQLRQQIPG